MILGMKELNPAHSCPHVKIFAPPLQQIIENSVKSLTELDKTECRKQYLLTVVLFQMVCDSAS